MIDLKKIQFERAQESDTLTLTEISFTAKRHWNYPDNYFKIWKDELTITKDYLNQNQVYKAIYEDDIIGFYAIVENSNDKWIGEIYFSKGFWLEHIFVKPLYHKLGIGLILIDHIKMISKVKGISNLLVFVDPFARGFYDRIGATFLYDSKSSIPGRMIPVYDLKIV